MLFPLYLLFLFLVFFRFKMNEHLLLVENLKCFTPDKIWKYSVDLFKTLLNVRSLKFQCRSLPVNG